ncbi:hypothetical protein Bca52824_080009 [Brassica carinata]|uniref:Uncharacterized protein n=1 Tax=Brassica carinata TaxID=52824 RepID=A0A8X7TZI9_BRACI|nr:hypothetical protein Bca52824_080009 [Brassica carinata]
MLSFDEQVIPATIDYLLVLLVDFAITALPICPSRDYDMDQQFEWVKARLLSFLQAQTKLSIFSAVPKRRPRWGRRVEKLLERKADKSWLRVSLASPKLRESISASPMKGLYYCVIYLRPGDHHRIYSPADWNALAFCRFGYSLISHLSRQPMCECIFVVLEGIWKQGFMALTAVGATNIGSIE